MNDPQTIFPARIWRGWLEQTGYHEDDMPLARCQELLANNPRSPDADSMFDYAEAWREGYNEAVIDLRFRVSPSQD
jgi:hypothetical protein